jgi:hypothetical protein
MVWIRQILSGIFDEEAKHFERRTIMIVEGVPCDQREVSMDVVSPLNTKVIDLMFAIMVLIKEFDDL